MEHQRICQKDRMETRPVSSSSFRRRRFVVSSDEVGAAVLPHLNICIISSSGAAFTFSGIGM